MLLDKGHMRLPSHGLATPGLSHAIIWLIALKVGLCDHVHKLLHQHIPGYQSQNKQRAMTLHVTITLIHVTIIHLIRTYSCN